MKILVIGASGMIGSTLLRVLSENTNFTVYGTIRNPSAIRFFSKQLKDRVFSGIDALNNDALIEILNIIRPNVVINCAGVTKHILNSENPLLALPINSLMPHRLAGFCKLVGSRLIHISTDCVFSGVKGNYTEEDFTDARDTYGRSKALGEVTDVNSLTLRISTIGYELETKYGLLEWFLSQKQSCTGYSNAIFSGLPTSVFATILRDIILPRTDLHGLYHVSAEPISKFDLLKLIAAEYDKNIKIIRDEKLVVNRSLCSERFLNATGYVPPSWQTLINQMKSYK